MIELDHVWKTYPTRRGSVDVLKDINLKVERGQKLGIVGGNGAGKSTLVRIIGGSERPSRGTVRQDMRISWPLAFGGAFQGSLTGLDNMRFICRVYNQDWHEVLDFVEDFSQLGRYLKEPMKVYSSGMRARLAFAISLCIEFDCYLLDEVFAVGDARFQQRCHDELFVKRADRAFIIVSHNAHFLHDHCNAGTVLHKGRLIHCATLDEAQQIHAEHMTSSD